MREVYIVSAVRTPIGSFGGALAEVHATKLGATAISEAINRIKLNPELVQEVFMGCVLQGNLGQAPARQAAIFAGLSKHVPCTTVNKVCSSGLKAVMLGAQTILAGDNDIVVAGGMENMSASPYYLEKARYGYKFGNANINDAIVKDGLTDVYNQKLMGSCAELCAKEYQVSREEQDQFAISSYTKAADAWKAGKFNEEIAPVSITNKKGETTVVSEDEEYKAVKFDKIPGLKPAFEKDGTVTAANASTINDGAAALVLMSKEKAEELGLKPLAIIRGYADFAHEPEWFTTAPAYAIPNAVKKAGLSLDQIDFFEINEAFSVVAIANNKIMGIDANKVNVNGGAVALGHPLGASGARILVTLIHVLKNNKGKYGAAGLCNGGGGASAMVIEAV